VSRFWRWRAGLYVFEGQHIRGKGPGFRVQRVGHFWRWRARLYVFEGQRVRDK
jgi:hypothetical protein